MSHLNRQRPCRLCGKNTGVQWRVCWRCHHLAYETEAGWHVSAPPERWPLWVQVIGRHIVRHAIADRARSGLTPIETAEAVVVEFEHPDAGSQFMTFTTAAFDAVEPFELHRKSASGPPVPGERLHVHDGRHLFSERTTERLLAEPSGPTDRPARP